LTIAGFRLDGKLNFRHSLPFMASMPLSIEVHEDLLELHAVCHDLGKILGKLVRMEIE